MAWALLHQWVALGPTLLQAMWAAARAGVQGLPGPGLATASSLAWPRPGWGSGCSWLSELGPLGRTWWAHCKVGLPGAGPAGSCLHWLSCCQMGAACPETLGMLSGPGSGALLPGVPCWEGPRAGPVGSAAKKNRLRLRLPSVPELEGVTEEGGRGGPESLATAPSSEGQGSGSLPGPVLGCGKHGKVCKAPGCT